MYPPPSPLTVVAVVVVILVVDFVFPSRTVSCFVDARAFFLAQRRRPAQRDGWVLAQWLHPTPAVTSEQVRASARLSIHLLTPFSPLLRPPASSSSRMPSLSFWLGCPQGPLRQPPPLLPHLRPPCFPLRRGVTAPRGQASPCPHHPRTLHQAPRVQQVDRMAHHPALAL